MRNQSLYSLLVKLQRGIRKIQMHQVIKSQPLSPFRRFLTSGLRMSPAAGCPICQDNLSCLEPLLFCL